MLNWFLNSFDPAKARPKHYHYYNTLLPKKKGLALKNLKYHAVNAVDACYSANR